MRTDNEAIPTIEAQEEEEETVAVSPTPGEIARNFLTVVLTMTVP